MIRELPYDDRPRERLLNSGSHAVSDAELLAILMRTGRRGCSALEMARELLADCGGLGGLLKADRASLRRDGLGEVKSASILAAVEVARRLARRELPDRQPLTNPAAAAGYLLLRYGRRDQEVMGALFLDSRNRLLGECELFRGTINRAAVEPRAVLREGLGRGAAGVLLFHTHPSGDPSPSVEDLAFTRRMAEAGEIVGIRLVDHLVLGDVSRWVSLKQRGAW